ncbi:MAG: phosphoenolpyruvate carboxylase [Gammaproteobacteria bacterium]|nr:phosphoenolpyruvate carboxylase [Gammaproteobacteria bacterium]MBK6584872.1 phosphoenolpyruvate carboxylase [Gammaproteobacteria bacterium]MBK7171185.1 phosphoenolpyruvate carboxylase [Gammaproteobacteria bacterium]MBK9666490.1 phosphoenolpyruvate carboxylase [Gammaproteobacteria bacterium]
MSDQPDYSSLRSNVSFLGRLLGETIAAAEGPPLLELIERIRRLSKAAREGEADAHKTLLGILRNLEDRQLVPVARAFSQFLNLANIADQHHTISREMDPLFSASEMLAGTFRELHENGASQRQIIATVDALRIELVLTAHPTEITRRTLIHKHGEITACLGQLELQGLTERERQQIHARLRELIAQIWHGYDFRQQRPTPVEEAKWGFAVLENSLWQAVPQFLRRLDTTLAASCNGARLPLAAAPVSFVSWMGGDRDGNPNVTAVVTEEVLLLSRWQAADLYLKDVVRLIDELSMSACDERVRAQVGAAAHEPYRALLRPLRDMLKRTLMALNQQLAGVAVTHGDILVREAQLWEPLAACYQSMLACGMEVIAERALLDLLRRVRCFGVHLLRHDIRQDSSRHTAVLAELTRWLGIGDYAQWDEAARQAFLLQELQSRRPLIPADWEPGAEAREVLATCEVIARQEPTALGAYVISMAKQPSDVLAVHLLLKASGCKTKLPVAPLFETLADLDNARAVIATLLANEWYRAHIDGRLMVMIGYSDSAKDAGVLAASWAQYRAQEELLAVCAAHAVDLTLFHGRGGTIGRGGAPAHAALLSQPPGSLKSGLRVTEQGEMIRAKLGLGPLAIQTLALYASAICKANLHNPPAPEPAWREAMSVLAAESCAAYRAVLRGEADFVEYFLHATPVQELAKLPLGSRPARRAGGGGVESLRAIPWIFAWTQNRLMLPAWLGAGVALRASLDRGQGELLQEMAQRWPFFATRLAMLEMVFIKADAGLSAHYDECLVPEKLKRIGAQLRSQLGADITAVLALTGAPRLLDDQPWIRRSIQLRNIYTDPLNFLQAELLHRERRHEGQQFDQAIMVTIAGIAAGMRNTG